MLKVYGHCTAAFVVEESVLGKGERQKHQAIPLAAADPLAECPGKCGAPQATGTHQSAHQSHRHTSERTSEPQAHIRATGTHQSATSHRHTSEHTSEPQAHIRAHIRATGTHQSATSHRHTSERCRLVLGKPPHVVRVHMRLQHKAGHPSGSPHVSSMCVWVPCAGLPFWGQKSHHALLAGYAHKSSVEQACMHITCVCVHVSARRRPCPTRTRCSSSYVPCQPSVPSTMRWYRSGLSTMPRTAKGGGSFVAHLRAHAEARKCYARKLAPPLPSSTAGIGPAQPRHIQLASTLKLP